MLISQLEGVKMKLLKVFVLALSSAMISCFSYAEDMKVGFIYIGPPGDHGWNYQHDVGRKAVDEALGTKLKLFFKKMYRKVPMLKE